jgi:hypothetical protein
MMPSFDGARYPKFGLKSWPQIEARAAQENALQTTTASCRQMRACRNSPMTISKVHSSAQGQK